MFVNDESTQDEILHAYVQADAPGRAVLFSGFIGALKILQKRNRDEAAAWARRAISPLLDYSSLLTLRRFLVPGEKGPETNTIRLAILGGPTTIQLRQLIEVFLAGAGLHAEIYEAEYGLFRQEILTPGSGLDAFQPNLIFLATSARDIAHSPSLELDTEKASQLAAVEVDEWRRLWETCQARWNATVIQNNFEIMPWGVLGHFALRHPGAPQNYVERLNRLLAEAAPSHVVLHDLHGLAVEAGARTWFDPRFYLEFKMPCSPEGLVIYAHSVVSLLRAIRGQSKRVLVLDLDNTLWGGEVGELGPGGIRIGQGSGEGEAFLAFQHYLKAMQERGVLLAVCSKNDAEKAREPFEKRADMVLKLADISCFVANWENKADNLVAIARQLNLKTEALVFIDDRPAERAIVRRLLPEVAVPDMPEDPAGFIPALALHRYVETVAFTREDISRARYYADNSRRQDALGRSSDIESFLASLKMRMNVQPINDLNIERATQLINKSNQFNLTTRRYTQVQVKEMAASSDWHTLTFSLRDNLGDNGLISVLLLRRRGDDMEIDSWVMSCRVLQRGVEQFVRNELVKLAAAHAYCRILGTYIPTPKNSMVKDLLLTLGFAAAGQDDAQVRWSLPLDRAWAPLPHHIESDAAHG